MLASHRLRPSFRRLATVSRRYKSASTAESVNVEASSSASSTRVVLQSLLAVGAGVMTVSVAAFAVEQSTAAKVPSYHPNRQRFGSTNFGERFSSMLLACDPRLLLYTQDQVQQAKALLERHQECPPSMDRALWEARRVVDSALNPDTGDWIPRPFRMSGYVPCNGPICVAMLSSTSTAGLLFWSWVNQSQNALVNYYNRNASSPMTNETLAVSYGAAVGSALVVAYGLSTVIQRRFPAPVAKRMLRWVAFPSAVVASSLNCYIVRSPEISAGVPLTDAEGRNVLPGATSQKAAAAGVYSTTASRAILQAPVYFLPPLLIGSLPPIRALLARRPALALPLTTYMVLVSFGLGLPATVAIFPQQSPIDATQVESKFQHLRDPATNKPYSIYYYNKGL